MLEKEHHALYKEVYEQHRVLLPLIYEPEKMGALVEKQLKDLFFCVYKPATELYIYPQLSFSHSFRIVLIEGIMKSWVVKQYGWKFQGNYGYSFCFALYLTMWIADWISDYLAEYPDHVSTFSLLIAHANTNIEGLFNESFQTIQPYPKDIMVANSNVVKYITRVLQTESNLFEQGVRQAYVDASILYEDMYNKAAPLL